MTRITAIFLFVIIIASVAFTGLFSKSPNTTNLSAPAGETQCVDYDPPSPTETVTFQGTLYKLIKRDGSIISSKMGEMKEVGTTADGKKIFQMESSNYSGQKVPEDIIFVLKNVEKDPKQPYFGTYIFDIYLKDGVPIPDVVKNCKPSGGELKIVIEDRNQFPPAAFNTDQIIGLNISVSAPSYVHSGNKTTFDSVKALPEVKPEIGSLLVSSKSYVLYFHLEVIYLIDGTNAYEYLPNDSRIDLSRQDKKSLQLKQIKFASVPSISWYTPACKPAIYLYPKEETDVNVRVKTQGFLTYTDPVYVSSGWEAKAYPSGKLIVNGRFYDYLYYESKIPDSEIKKPREGFVISYGDLPGFYDEILPKLGLNSTEAQGFKDYWVKALPYSPYYFVGIMKLNDIEKLEPLTINPAPDTIIRARIYFEAISEKIEVSEPEIETPKRQGFTAVEWGGMVKLEKGSKFTCSQ